MAAENLDTDQAIVEKDPHTGALKATAYFEDYLYKIVATLGGEGSTIIQDLVNTTIEADKVEYMFALIKQLIADTSKFNSVIKTADYTAANKDWVEARNKITILFPENPVKDDEIMVSNGDGSAITVDGNGELFKYTSTDTVFITRNMGSSYHFQYFEDNNLNERYWRVR